MKRNGFFLSLSSLALFLCSHCIAQDLDNVTIPAKTEFFIRLQRTISSKTAVSGDRFHAVTEVPVTQDDRIIIPEGTYIIGFVDVAEAGGRFKGKSILRLRFDTVILPSGLTRKIEAVVQSAEGQKLASGDEQGTLSGGGSQTREVAGGAGAGAAVGGVAGVITGGISGLATGGLVGAASGAVLALFKKGREVVLPRGSSLTIQLEDEIRFVKP